MCVNLISSYHFPIKPPSFSPSLFSGRTMKHGICCQKQGQKVVCFQTSSGRRILNWYVLPSLLSFIYVFLYLILHEIFVIMENMQRALVKRLHSLLTIKESASNIPKNLEARRRLEFFTNSLFMEMPIAKPVQEMQSFR